MKKTIILGSLFAVLASICMISADQVPGNKADGRGDVARQVPPRAGTATAIDFHNGPVMQGTTHVYYIWYGDWAQAPAADAILTNFASHIGGSPYFNINTTYGDATGNVSNAVTYAGSYTDAGSRGTSVSDDDIWSIVTNAFAHGLPVDGDGVYFVLTAPGVAETSGFLSQYCGWHNYGAFNGTNVKFAFVGDAAGPNLGACAAQPTGPNGDAGADAMASVVAHELEESVTDPLLNAWYDAAGNESADKCAWTFGNYHFLPNGAAANMALGGLNYLIQQNWLNAGGGSCALSYAAPDDTSSVSPGLAGGATARTVSASGTFRASAPAAAPAGQWVDSWGASFLSTTVNGAVQAAPSFNNQTLRLRVFSKLGGTQARVKLTNKFGTNTLTVGAAHVALVSSGSSITASSDRALTFGGLARVTLAPGAEMWSDAVTLTIGQHVTVAVSVYIPGSFKPTTFHPTGLHTSYLSRTGNFVASTALPLATFSNTTTEVVVVSGLQVWAPTTSEVAVAFGDSITDGACSSNDANGTWPDILSNRLPTLPSSIPFSVINMGIGSNRLVASDQAGPSGVHRFADDVLARPNVRYVALLEGINDISYEHATAATITGAYATLVAQSHAAGIKVYGATLLPIGNSTKYTAANEATRQAVNAWIRTAGNFDAVLDFEAVVKDPATSPLRIKSSLTCDYVHPNAAGYSALGNSIPTTLFH